MSYASDDNFFISKHENLLGFKISNDQSYRKAEDLRIGDIVLIRDSRYKTTLEFFGSCVVVEEPYQELKQKLIWSDELYTGQLIYEIRVKVDFKASPVKNLDKLSWNTMLNWGWRNQKGKLMDVKALKLLTSKANFADGQRANQLWDFLVG